MCEGPFCTLETDPHQQGGDCGCRCRYRRVDQQTGFAPPDDLRAMEQLFSHNRRPVEIPEAIAGQVAAIEVIPPTFDPNHSFLVIDEDQSSNLATTLIYGDPPQDDPEESTQETDPIDLTRVPIGWLVSLLQRPDTEDDPTADVRDPIRQEVLIITPDTDETDETGTPVVTPLTLDFGRPTLQGQPVVTDEETTPEPDPDPEATGEPVVETETDPVDPIPTQIAGVTSAVADPHRLMESPVHLAIVGNPRPVAAVQLRDPDTGEVAAALKQEEMWRINFLNENGDVVGGNISGPLDRPLEKPIDSYVAAILDSEGNVLDTAPVSAPVAEAEAEAADPSSSGSLETLRNEFDAQAVQGGVEVTVHPMEESRIMAAIQARFSMLEEDARRLARSAESVVELRDAEGTVLQSQRFDPTRGTGPLRWPARPGSRVEVVTHTYFRQAEALAVAQRMEETQRARVNGLAEALRGPLNAAMDGRFASLRDWIQRQGPPAER